MKNDLELEDLQNQIIKRTPLEEKIVAYYEKNRSFEGKLFTEN